MGWGWAGPTYVKPTSDALHRWMCDVQTCCLLVIAVPSPRLVAGMGGCNQFLKMFVTADGFTS